MRKERDIKTKRREKEKQRWKGGVQELEKDGGKRGEKSVKAT
jgi:hypothetical protein